MSFDSFKRVISKMCLQIILQIYLIYMYKEDLALNNLQWLICNKTKPNQSLSVSVFDVQFLQQT